MHESATDPVDYLLACHARIRGFTNLARRIADTPGAPDGQVIDAARQLHWFFGKALPLHAEDEDRSVAPRLLRTALDHEVELALAAQAAQHPIIDGLSMQLGEILRTVVDAPARLDAVRPAVAAAAKDLSGIWDVHLEYEEQKIFPAVRRLAPAVKQEILGEFFARGARIGSDPAGSGLLHTV